MLTLVLSLSGVVALSQGFLVTEDRPFIAERAKDSSILGPISRTETWKPLNSSEKEYIYWVNFMREDPPRFYKAYVEPFLAQFPEARSTESESLRSDLRKTSRLPLLWPDAKLNRAATPHANYLTSTGTISHTGAGGRSFAHRMEEAGVNVCAGEVIFQGKDDALIALVLLLIDHRVPGTGHRKALLDASFTKTGIGVSMSNDQRAIFVQILSCN
jgi:hypothetical protein